MLTTDPAELTESLRLDSTADRTIEGWVAECRALTMEDPERGVSASARLIEIAEATASKRLRARALSAHCHALSYAGRMKQAIAIAEQAIETATDSADSIALAEACMTAVQSHNVLGLREEALTLASRAGEIFKAEGDHDRSATATMLAGVVLRMLDRPGEALLQFDSALTTVGPNPSLRAQLASNRAEALLDLGRFADAKASFEIALEGFRSCHQHFGEAIVEGNLADLASRRGNLHEALQLFLGASSKFRSESDEAEAARLEAEAAELFLAIGDHREALYRLPRAIETLNAAGMQTEHARALAAFAIALERTGELESSLQKLDESERLSAAHDQQQAAIRASVLRGSLLLASGRALEAVTVLKAALNAHPLEPIRARLLIDLARAFASLGETEESRVAIDEAKLLAGKLGLAGVDTSLSTGYAMLARLSGNLNEARQHVAHAIKCAESRRNDFTGDRLRATAIGGVRLAYEEGIRLALAANDPRLAYEIAEHAHARTLRDAGGLTDRTNHSATLIAIEGDIAATLSQIEDARASGREDSHILRLRDHLRELEQQLASLEMRDQSKPSGQGHAPKLPSLSNIQASMPEGAVAILLASAGDRFARLTLTAKHASLTELNPSVREIAKRCDGMLSNIDRALVRLAVGRSVPENLDNRILCELDAFGSLILEGIETPLVHSGRLVLVLPRDLARLPVAVLRYRGRYLAELCTPVVAPSLSWATELASRQPSSREGLLAIGVADELAPSIDTELDAIANAIPDATVIRNEEASFERLRRESAHCGVLHLSCHGEYSAADPMGSRLKLGDGWVSARRISDLDLQDVEVALGGCETGTVDSLAGEQFGLIRACLLAGAKSVVASRWRLADEPATRIFSDLYRSSDHPDLNLPSKLSRIQAAAARNAEHPALWGALFALGSW